MAQLINIPALKGQIVVDLGVSLGDKNKMRFEDFPDDDTPYDSALTLPPKFWDYLRGLPAGNQDTRLKVEGMLSFPPVNAKGEADAKNVYQQHVYAVFPFVFQSDEIRFLV